MTVLGVDVAWFKLPSGAVKSAGYSFVIGYLSDDPSKNLTAAQIDAYHSAGLSVLLVWETAARRALDGMTAGIADGRAAVAQAQALGYPIGVPIFFACDTDATVTQVRPYFRGVATVLACGGAYGGIRVVDPLLADGTVKYGWQTCAWSNDPTTGKPEVSTSAHLYQRPKPTTGLHGSFDENVLLRPLPMFDPPQPAPIIPEDDMAPIYLVKAGDPNAGEQFYNFGTPSLVHIDGPTSEALHAAGVPIIPVSWVGLVAAGAQP